MSEGKDPVVAKRFQQCVSHLLILYSFFLVWNRLKIDKTTPFFRINRYFDGKCTDDEILFRAEITRKQLREVLHHFEEYVCLTPLLFFIVVINIEPTIFLATNHIASFLIFMPHSAHSTSAIFGAWLITYVPG